MRRRPDRRSVGHMRDHTQPTLVISSTGKTGSRVAERLEARGIPTRAGSRSADPPFDWEDPDTWAAALEGAGAAYVSYYPDIAMPGAVEAITAFAETALRQDVRRLVLLSGRGEEEAHVGKVYELTGPRPLTFEEAVGEIAAATGREIRYVPVSIEEYTVAARGHGVPKEVVEFLEYLFGEVLDGRNASLTDGAQRALGRGPRDFSQYAREAASTGVWNGPAVVG